MSQPTTAAVATSSGARRMVSRAWRRRVARHSAQLQGVGRYGMAVSLAGYRPPRCQGERTRQGEWLGDEGKHRLIGINPSGHKLVERASAEVALRAVAAEVFDIRFGKFDGLDESFAGDAVADFVVHFVG